MILRLTSGVAAGAVATQVVTSPAFADNGSPNSVPNPPSTIGILISISPSEQRFDVSLTLTATPCPRGTAPNARVDISWDDFVIVTSPAPPLTSISPSPPRTTYLPNSGSTPTSYSTTFLFQVDPTGRGPNTKFVAGDIVRFDINYRFVCRNSAGQAVWVCRSFRYTITFSQSGGNLVASVAIATTTPPANCDGPPAVVAP